MEKECGRCHAKYHLRSGKGSAKAKYCPTCKVEVRKEFSRKSEAIRFNARHPIGSDDEILYYGYKEPLTKFEGGFGYKGVVSYSKDRQQVQCHFCGRFFRNVGIHAKFSHGLHSSEYKVKIGLAQKTALV